MNKPQIKLAGTRNELKTINKDLQIKCGSSHRLVLSQYRHRDAEAVVYAASSSLNDYDIILCLYHENMCMSSITGRYNSSKHAMELLSKTDPQYEGLKYNLYLRTVFMYLMCFVRPTVQTIYSQSTNPISTYTMYKHYHIVNKDLQEYVKTHNVTPETFTLENATQFHEHLTEKNKVTPENVQEELDNQLDMCSDALGRKCSLEDLEYESIEEAIVFIRNTMNYKPAPQLEFDLSTCGVKDFLLHKALNIHPLIKNAK